MVESKEGAECPAGQVKIRNADGMNQNIVGSCVPICSAAAGDASVGAKTVPTKSPSDKSRLKQTCQGHINDRENTPHNDSSTCCPRGTINTPQFKMVCCGHGCAGGDRGCK